MTLGHNLLAGLANSTWSAIVGLAAVPFYLKYLGIEAYGLIGFFVATQAVLSLLDMGMAPTISREVARCSATGNLKEAGKLLHTLAVVYWTMAGLIALVILALAPLIAGYWLQSKQLSPETIAHALMLMGLVVACRWPIGLYQGALMGAQRMTVSSGINMVMVTISSLGAVMVLAFVSPTIEAFFIWQASVGLVYAIIMRAAAWRIIGKVGRMGFDVDRLKSVWRFTAGMSGVAISAVILMQLDKVLLSKILSLEDFGRYALAGVVASGLYILLSPTFNVIYPRMSAHVATRDMVKLVSFYRSGTRILGAILFPMAAAAAMTAKEILLLWTGNPSLASSTAPIVSMLLIGTALNGIMHFPYALQLAFGFTRIPLIITVVLSITLVPLIVILTSAYGAVGGASAWIILNFIYLLFGTWLTHRYILKGMALEWLLRDVGVPLGVTLAVMFSGWMLLHESGIMNILLAITLALISFFLCVLLTLSYEVKIVFSRFILNKRKRGFVMSHFRKIKECLKRLLGIKLILSTRHFVQFEMRDIRDSYFSKSLSTKATPYGFKLVGSSSRHHRAMQLGTFEPEEIEIFRDRFRAADVFIDVGSNIGFYACMARLEGLHVMAVEPLQSNLEYLYANLKANEWTDVEVFPMGLTDKSGIATLFGASSTGASLIGNWAGASKMFQRTIPLSTLDILTCNRFTGKKIFIKIDVEGVEYSVLSGALQLIKTEPKPTWVLEVCLNEYYPGGLNPHFSEVFDLFWKNGYEVRTADKRSKLILPEDVSRWMKSGNSDSGAINYIFLPV